MVDWRSRKPSGNIEDRRAYFGSMSVDPGYYYEDRNADFLKNSLLSPYLTAEPQTFRDDVHLSIEDLLALLAAQKSPNMGLTLSAGVLK